jgi:hypothetical protein
MTDDTSKAVAVVRRQKMEKDREPVFKVRGRYVSADDVDDVAVVAGPIVTAWWDVPLPACPDCGGALAWAEAGYVPGTRECSGCRSLFSVDTSRSEP